MPIMAVQGRNDARVAVRLLANTAKDCLSDPKRAPEHAVMLNNVYRLLEAYRVNVFFGLEQATDYRHAGETLSLTPAFEQHVGDVRDVLERAMETTFCGQTKDEAIAEIANVLKQVVYPEFGAPSDTDKLKAEQFFSEVVQQLQLT